MSRVILTGQTAQSLQADWQSHLDGMFFSVITAHLNAMDMTIKTGLLCISLVAFLFSCTEGNESDAEKELDQTPGMAGKDSTAIINGLENDSIARITPKKTTE